MLKGINGITVNAPLAAASPACRTCAAVAGTCKEGEYQLLMDSNYRRMARDYAANMFQRWHSQAELAGIVVDEFNQADIDKFADGLLAESLTRFKMEIAFNQHLDIKVNFIPTEVI
jgi:hypothetical protein